MKTGDLITVVDFRDNRLQRTIVEISGDTLYICTAEEFKIASDSGRRPIVVGFNKRYVVSE